ncbi:MAG: helicase C-terminal domain-containing protein [Candidatus Doudnabacteria bacterium]|nr:helicase C-terminal domain-containing protein [Candidatus Doudnabacteria bacterium]
MIDKLEQREVLKKIETLIYDLRRYILSLEYSMPTEKHKALNYTYAYYEEMVPEGKKVQYKLVINSYYVAPLVQKLLPRKMLAMSGTIGNPEYFGYETGIKAPFYALKSDFPASHTLICLPSDVADLSFGRRSRQDLNKTFRRIIRASKRFANRGHRSLIVVQSNEEREKVMRFSEEEGLNAISYGNGVHAKEVLERFKGGEGDALLGTMVHYGEGVDLPDGLAEVIFFLRPGYPSPFDPQAQFEAQRFPEGHKYALWKWRAMIQCLQVRSRIMRSKKAKGVTFYMSQQFKSLLYHALPEELKEAYDRVRGKTFDECVQEAEKLLD